jgi:FKBP-type peptidyl-prolyl cis-trans isomerase
MQILLQEHILKAEVISALRVAEAPKAWKKPCSDSKKQSRKTYYNYNNKQMKKISSFLAVAASIVMLAACGDTGYKKTSSGLMYKIVKKGDGAVAKRGDIIKLHYTQTVDDSVLVTSAGKMPVYQRVDSVEGQYDPSEIFRFLKKGDSVVIVQMVDTFMKKNPTGLPPFLKKGGKILTGLRVVDVFTSEDLAKADGEKEMAKEKTRQDKEMEAASGQQVKDMETYLAKNNIKAQKTGKGTYVAITDPGNGPAADSGTYLTVRYTGKLLETDKVFESNMEGDKPPFSFVVGTGNVIPGWDEGEKLTKR